MQIIQRVKNINLNFDVKNNGVYIFSSKSGIGKTYLADVLDAVSGVSIYVVTYNKHKSVMDTMLNDICNGQYSVIFLDRFDLYENDEWRNVINSKRDDSIILVDCKDISKLRIPNLSVVYFDKNNLEMVVYAKY